MPHTPGPWTRNSEGSEGYSILADHSAGWKHIAMVEPNQFGTDIVTEEEAQANAQLMATAPDLLDALTSIVNDCREVLEGRERMSVELMHSIVNGKAKHALARAAL